MLSLDKGKPRLKLLFALFTLVFILFASSPVVAFANEGNYVSERVHIIDKDNYYTDEEKQEIAKEIRKSEQVHDIIKLIAPLNNEDAKKLSFEELVATEYPDLFLDVYDVAMYAPWLEGEYAGAFCDMRGGGRYSRARRCFYLENVDSAKDRDGSVDNMVSLVKTMQAERLKEETSLRSKMFIAMAVGFLIFIVLLFLPE